MEGKGKHITIQNMRISLEKKPLRTVTELSKHYIIACFHYHRHLHHYFRERGQKMQKFGGERQHNTFKGLKKLLRGTRMVSYWVEEISSRQPMASLGPKEPLMGY